ncbi:MAG: right-handed parallel beta-helix repeat-containing protein [Phycisphaerae bacterium]|jgi:hypothetical protein
MNVALFALPLLSVSNAWAEIIYVDSAVGGVGGTSWGEAFADLQSALAVAHNGDEIWVASGTYAPSGSDATTSFVLSPGVALYGGFAGDESTRGERDWKGNETILSGDIGRDDVVFPWPSGWNINTANAGHVVVAGSTNRDTVLDGFTIANGHTGPPGTPAGHELMFGSGVYIVNGSPTIRHCTFKHNVAAFGSGGGLYCRDGSPLVEHCSFTQNYAHGGGGGGMFVYGDSTPEIKHCEFRDNISVATSISNVDGDAAGLGIYSTQWVTVSDCRFDANVARPFYPVGDELGYGGGLWAWNGGLTVKACEFVNNRANYGAGLITWGPALVINSLFRNNTSVVQPNDPYPEEGGDGAAIVAWSASSDVVDVINCTVAYNHGKKYVGAVAFWEAQVNVHNSIVRDNAGTHPETIGTWKEQVLGFGELAYSNVSHIFEPHGPGEDPLDPADLPGVIDADPLFVNPSPNGDLHLLPGSPCIDAGNNTAVPAGTLADLDGHARFVDEPVVPDTGVGDAPVVDMGAFEHRIMQDYDRDGDVDVQDYAALLDCYSGPNLPPTPLVAAFDHCVHAFDGKLDRDIDLQDFASFQAMFDPGN